MIDISQADNAQLTTVIQWPIWQKAPCTFDEDYTEKEMFYILEGRANLSIAGQPTSQICAGDLVTIEAGVIVTWQILEEIKKHYKFF